MRLGLAVPMYNEAALATEVVGALVAALEAREFRLAIVDNGSQDGTGAILDGLAESDDRLIVVHLARNAGYGGGIQAGIVALRAWAPEVLGWAWGDGQVDPSVIPVLLDQIAAGAHIAKARRTARHDGWQRRLVTTGYALSTRALGVRTRDVNGCPKLVRAETWHDLAPRSTDWFLDAELILGAEAAGLRITDAPVVMARRKAGRSKVRWATMAEFVVNLGRWRVGR